MISSDKVLHDDFSIVTICKNNLEGLKKTYSSVIAQDFQNFELLIIDGASEDDTLNWLKNLKDSRVKWRSEIDAGVYEAMNKGAAIAKGEILVFLHAGDFFADSYVLNRVLISYSNYNWDWAYGIMKLVNENYEYIQLLNQHPFNRRNLSLGLSYIPHQSTFYNLDFFKQVGFFDPQYSIAADQEFAIRASAISPPHSVVDIWTDFLAGGLHSQINYWDREKIYHNIRKNNSELVFNSKNWDFAYSIFMGTLREIKEFAGKFLS